MDIILKTTELTKSFKGQIAVNRISLSIERNSVYGLLGPNGIYSISLNVPAILRHDSTAPLRKV